MVKVQIRKMEVKRKYSKVSRLVSHERSKEIRELISLMLSFVHLKRESMNDLVFVSAASGDM